MLTTISYRPERLSNSGTFKTSTLEADVRLSEGYRSSGVNYLRKMQKDRKQKDRARYELSSNYFSQKMRSLDRPCRFFTMPAYDWQIEKSMIGYARAEGKPEPIFDCVEIDPAIFSIALTKLPKPKGEERKYQAVDPLTITSHYIKTIIVEEQRIGKILNTIARGWIFVGLFRSNVSD